MILHGDMILYTFVFLLRVSLFVVTGIVLHQADGGPVLLFCPVLWESMATILIIKCLRVTICSIVVKLMRSRRKGFEPLDFIMHVAFFIIQCIVTSRAFNTAECITSDGAEPLTYVNCISCVWDGCYVLACALHAALFKKN
jgi:hypothetical protein